MNLNTEYIYYFTIMRFIIDILLHSTLRTVCPKWCSIIFYDTENTMLNGVSHFRSSMLFGTMLIEGFL